MIDRERVRELLRRPAFLVTVAAVVVALIVGGFAWNLGRTPDAIADASHPSPTGSAGSSPGTGSVAGDDPWSSLDPSATFQPLSGDAAARAAVLTARGATGAVVPLDASFRLASADGTPASILATRLTVQPDFAFSVAPEAGDQAALLTPAAPLQPGTVYRFALASPAGVPLDSWAFQAHQPLRVIGTLPDNQAADVPVDTGIEITFDQDGVADAESHVSVAPATPGRFEQHGRTLAFIADHPLKPATIYTVTVSRGVTVAGTGEATDKETKFQFETAATNAPTSATTFSFQNQVLESPSAERPVIGVWWFGEDHTAPKTLRIEVYRLANLTAAIDAFRTLRARPDWSRYSADGLVDTTKLSREVSVDAGLHQYTDAFWLQLPEKLAAGWYLIQAPAGTRPIQTVLQVTDVAGYLSVSQTRTLVWVNDLKTGRPIVGATATIDGTDIGRTDRDGLALGPTPTGLLPEAAQNCVKPCDPVVTVQTADGRAILLPAALAQDKLDLYGGSNFGPSDAASHYWSLLHSDRDRYRQTDTVNIWGVVRDRDDGTVPTAVVLRLTPQPYDDGNVRPPVARLTVHPGSAAAFSGSLQLTDLAPGYYTIDALVGSDVIQSRGISVGPIAKPAYRLDIQTGRRIYIAGDRIKITVGASFFEGTPVPGVPLRINGFVGRNVVTDASGTATYRTITKVDKGQEGPVPSTVDVSPARAEEAEITGASRDFVIFPSSRNVDATARIAGSRIQVSGSVHLVDVNRLESEITGGQSIWELNPNGAAVRGATVTVRFVELVPVRTKTGTEYDFIEKKVVPTYDERVDERAAGSIRVKTAANGTYRASIPATTTNHDYNVIVTVADPGGHVAQITSYAGRHVWSVYDDRNATLRETGVPDNVSAPFGIGDRVDVTMGDPMTRQAAGDGTRYLFVVAQRGIRTATVQTSPRYITSFAPWAAPTMYLGAVRFTGHGYVAPVSFAAYFRAADRRIQVDLSVPTARYAPGQTATVNVTTRTASGAPTAATVILRAVDEKLFTIGGASQDDPLAELYAPVGSGIVGTYLSHRNPRTGGGEGGDTTGGGGDDRDTFRDALLFKTIVTDANGHGSVSFPLSDDLTSWRVTASAITSRLEAGSGSVLVPVGLPFFVDASVAPEYLAADRPSIPVRAFGSAVAPGDAVTIQVTSTSLGFDSGPIRAKAYATTIVPLPALYVGTQTITITGTTGTGATARTDRLTRSFTVVETHLTQARTKYVELPATGSFSGGSGLTTVVVSDATAGRYLPLLNDLAEGGGARLDRGLAADIASSLLVSHFGTGSAVLDGGAFDAARYQAPDGGLALLPYSSSDLELSVLVALVAPDRVNRNALESYLRGVYTNTGETRERQIFALAGMAGLGDAVLPALQAAAASDALTTRERLVIGLGAAALGDDATARSIAAALIAGHGEQLGQQARLRVGTTAADITTATALMAVLTAAVGDARAPLFWAYVEENPAVDQLEVLPAAGYATEMLARLPVRPASFAYTVDGTRSVITLEQGKSFELSLTAKQLASLTIERIAGSVGVTTSWHETIKPTALQPDPDISISRSVRPAGTVGSSDLVTVELTVTFGLQAAAGCHQVTDLVPSGLMPVGSLASWVDPNAEDETIPSDGATMPYDQSGPRVFFCADPSGPSSSRILRYFARVVTPGTYAWEPAIAESRSQDGRASLTAAGEVVIR
jgi:hypothetical protein